jgi:NADH dehydrogenase FAD-containing subunit
MKRILVVGGGYAGVLAAVRAQRALARQPAPFEVVLLSERDRWVERIRLHQQLAGQPLKPRPLAPLAQAAGFQLKLGRAARVDAAARTVWLESGERLAWDSLVLAIGSQTRSAPDGALTLDIATTDAGRARLAALGDGKLCVVGGGLTGIEAAAELAEAMPRLEVSLHTRGVVGPMLIEPARAHLRRALEALGVTLREQTSGGGDADLALYCGGFDAGPGLRALGLQPGAAGQLEVPATLEYAPGLFVAGDSARVRGLPLEMGCKSAMPMGAHAGDNAARAVLGRPLRDLDFGHPGHCISLGRRDAIVQLADRAGAPTGRVLTGRLGAAVKEGVCRYTATFMDLEARGLMRYRWLSGGSHAEPSRIAG